jgi:hypothetical protein
MALQDLSDDLEADFIQNGLTEGAKLLTMLNAVSDKTLRESVGRCMKCN